MHPPVRRRFPRLRRAAVEIALVALVMVIALAAALMPAQARAMTPAQAASLVAGEDTDARIAALAALAGDPDLPRLAQAMLDGEVRVAAGRVLIVQGASAIDAASGQPAPVPGADAEEPVVNNRLRAALEGAAAARQLESKDLAQRRASIDELAKQPPQPAMRAAVERALAAETDAALKGRLTAMRDAIVLTAGTPAERLAAAKALGASAEPSARALLQQRLAPPPDGEADAAVRGAIVASTDAVQRRLAWGEALGTLFAGASLGSILLLAALGLAVSYGLMGVINMAHGELIMVGAYATYVVQNLFRAHLPGLFDWYLVAAVPVAFAASAAVGAVIERGVIRFLYDRPLETLLATWGLSLILIQSMRSVFGAQNVPVENPSWLAGGWQVLPNLVLPANRIAILAFAFAVLGLLALLIARTRLGLFVRGVTQNRRMASCLGVNTARTDMLAFALGAGIAGLAGCALSQVGNVGPDLGQTYIVDSFMVVVLGGVGQLAGTVLAALGLGLANKAIEGFAGAVLAKIAVLVFIVVFIQKRPQGLFAMKGRAAD